MLTTIEKIEYLALKGCEINTRIRNLQSELEEIKTQLREYAAKCHSEIKDGVFTFLDPMTGKVCCQVRFPPSSVVVDSQNIDKLISALGTEEFDRCFTVSKSVKVDQTALESIADSKAIEISELISLRRNTPRVSFNFS